jgi:hypothetical protein
VISEQDSTLVDTNRTLQHETPETLIVRISSCQAKSTTFRNGLKPIGTDCIAIPTPSRRVERRELLIALFLRSPKYSYELTREFIADSSHLFNIRLGKVVTW